MLFIPNRACLQTESCSRTILVTYATRHSSLCGVHTYMALHSIGCIRISCLFSAVLLLFNHIKRIRLIKPCLIPKVEDNRDYSLVPEQRTGCLSPGAPFSTVICTELSFSFLIIKMSHTVKKNTGSQREKPASPFTEWSVKYRFHKMSCPAMTMTGSLSLPVRTTPLLSKRDEDGLRWLGQVLTITIPSPTSWCSAVLLLSQSCFFLCSMTSEDF